MYGADALRAHVTGGSGFLGGFVIPSLIENGYAVTALARSPAAAMRVQSLGAEAVNGDLDDLPSLHDAFGRAQRSILVNLASLGFGNAPSIVEAAEAAGMTRAIFISSTSIFTTLDAPSKAVRTAAERTIAASGLDWTILRPTMIYGTPADRNMWRLLRLLQRTPVIPLPGGGKNLQQPIHVADLAQGVLAAAQTDASIRRSYDMAGPEPLAFRDIVAIAAEAVGRRPASVPVPVRPITGLLSLIEASGRSLPVSAEQVHRLTEDKTFDISAATEDLGFVPRSFRDGIRSEAMMLPS